MTAEAEARTPPRWNERRLVGEIAAAVIEDGGQLPLRARPRMTAAMSEEEDGEDEPAIVLAAASGRDVVAEREKGKRRERLEEESEKKENESDRESSAQNFFKEKRETKHEPPCFVSAPRRGSEGSLSSPYIRSFLLLSSRLPTALGSRSRQGLALGDRARRRRPWPRLLLLLRLSQVPAGLSECAPRSRGRWGQVQQEESAAQRGQAGRNAPEDGGGEGGRGEGGRPGAGELEFFSPFFFPSTSTSKR